MMQWKRTLCGALLFASGGVLAQQPGAGKAPSELEPAVNTSATVPAAAIEPAPAATGASAAKPAAKTSAAGTADAAKPAVLTSKPAAKPAGRSMDRLELEATQITGNRELPKVMYVVPWRRSDLGDLMGRPANSLLDEALTPVDRDVFRRQSQYYQALQPDQAGTAPTAVK